MVFLQNVNGQPARMRISAYVVKEKVIKKKAEINSPVDCILYTISQECLRTRPVADRYISF